uniref:Coat protein n=1 Tax=Aspergillus fumigatus partitivirus 1 TaxID=1027415 RepID=F8J354_9VIRU|nr:coat protein [Aspergillus fumigatus partitivirus 1]
MADNQSLPASTVAPSDSASKQGRKSKPGKAERQARRSAVGSQGPQPAAADKAMVFASGVPTPKPQPGKYPVVFSTGAGEPARDQYFAIDHGVLGPVLSSFPPRFAFNAKYAEFKAHADLDDRQFAKDLMVASLLRLAQQVVHTHVNMGLPQGDFAPVASTDVKVPASISAYLSQFGEHSVPALGTRFLFSDYTQTVRSLIWAADQMNRAQQVSSAPILRSWLPMSSNDLRFKTIIAGRLNLLLSTAGIQINPETLEAAVMSGSVPDAWESIKQHLGPPPGPNERDVRNRFDFLFLGQRSSAHFVTAWTTREAAAVLDELGLPWTNPQSGHVDWDFNAKEAFLRLSDAWARKSPTYAQFFELSSSQVNRTAATGSQAQMAVVSNHDSVTIVKTHLALTAPEFSLVACFPATGIYSGDLVRRVVVTTPLSVHQRATEFVQLDWR